MKIKKNSVITEERQLRFKSEVVTEVTPDVFGAIMATKTVMVNNEKWQGTSAIQVGYKYRLASIRIDNYLFTVINPIILLPIGLQFSNEGCASLGNKRYGLWRPLCGLVTFLDEDMNRQFKFYGKKHIRIFCHEIDHMNGRLIKDKGREWKRDSETSGHYLPKR